MYACLSVFACSDLDTSAHECSLNMQYFWLPGEGNLTAYKDEIYRERSGLIRRKTERGMERY